MSAPERMYPAKMAADKLGMTLSGFYRLINSGRGPDGLLVGRKLLYTDSIILEWQIDIRQKTGSERNAEHVEIESIQGHLPAQKRNAVPKGLYRKPRRSLEVIRGDGTE